MDELMRGVTKEKIRRRLLKLARELRLDISTAGWWNENRKQYPPIDFEGERVLLRQVKHCLAALDAGDMPRVTQLIGSMNRQAFANLQFSEGA